VPSVAQSTRDYGVPRYSHTLFCLTSLSCCKEWLQYVRISRQDISVLDRRYGLLSCTSS